MTGAREDDADEDQAAHDIVEDEVPAPGLALLFEDLKSTPGTDEVLDELPVGRPKDKVRGRLALGLLFALLVVIVIGAWGWLTDHQVNDWISFTAPVFTIIAGAMTFYFTKDADD